MDLWRDPAFATLSPRATKLFLDLAGQYNGYNNGDLSLARSLLKDRGWTSHDMLNRARDELLERRILVETRKGGRNRCSLYALTCYEINDCKGKLDAGRYVRKIDAGVRRAVARIGGTDTSVGGTNANIEHTRPVAGATISGGRIHAHARANNMTSR